MGHEKPLKMNWDKIKTIAEFDGHNENESIQIESSNLNDENNLFNDTIIESRPPTASTSLLIESLIQLLCLILENDPKLAEKSYKSICEQLNKINLIDKSYSLNEFEEMRSQYQMEIYKIICAVRGQDIPISLPNNNNNKQQSTVETCWSRYHREFEEISFIAGGGFGKVFRAKHKLDCIEYAVKQIKIHSTTIKLCHLAEVKTIASLNHPNIVQYKAAWLEPYLPKNNKTKKNCDSVQIEEIEDLEALPTSDTTDEDKFSQKFITFGLTEEGKFSKFKINRNFSQNNTNDQSSDFIQFERSNNDETVDKSNDTDNSNNSNKAICKYSSERRDRNDISSNTDEKSVIDAVIKDFYPKPKLAILYIQMSLCQLTLRKWLNERNSHRTFEEYYLEFFSNHHQDINHLDIVNDIFCQILSGLNYIHLRNIVHHDIKPSNIFLGIESDGKINAQLGDFGLACPLQNAHHGFALGTPLYAAPEQLKGQCNPKSDIYSLGIVLLELLIKFNTDMERVRTIENARKGILPPELNKKSSQLLRNLLSHIKSRPNTKELLEAIRVLNLEQNLRALRASQVDLKLKNVQIDELNKDLKTSQTEITNLLEEIDVRDKKIEELTKLLKEKDNEISKLKKLLKTSN